MLGNRKGFTLIELLVVMAIIGILAATAMVNSGKNPDRDVRQEADRFSSFLRDVQNKALASEKVSAATGKVCGFGVNFTDSSTAQIFYVQTKDDAGVSKFDINCSSAAKTMAGSSNSFASAIASGAFMFKSGVTIKDGSVKPWDIFFLIPNGDAYYNGSRLSVDRNLTISKTDGATATVSLTITPAGIIK